MVGTFTLTTFTPSEAEQITGLATVMQRDWRRRGFLPPSEGRARFDAFVLAEMLTLKMLTDRGIGPQIAKDIASWCGNQILWHALGREEAYEGDHYRTFEWPIEVGPKPEAFDVEDPETKRFLEEYPSIEIPEKSWEIKAHWLSTDILRSKKPESFQGRLFRPARYFFWWADGTRGGERSLSRAFGGSPDDPRYSGPIIVLNLVALASMLLDRAGRPLVRIKYPESWTISDNLLGQVVVEG